MFRYVNDRVDEELSDEQRKVIINRLAKVTGHTRSVKEW